MDSRGAPKRIGRSHACDKDFDLGVDRRAAAGAPAGELGPVLAEAAPLPTQHVSGVTITRACLHPAQTLDSRTQKRRSVLRSLGRPAVLLYTAS